MSSTGRTSLGGHKSILVDIQARSVLYANIPRFCFAGDGFLVFLDIQISDLKYFFWFRRVEELLIS